MNPRVKSLVEKELIAVVKKLEKRAKDLNKKGLEALTGPSGSLSTWTQKQQDDYFNQTSEGRIERHDKLIDEQLDCEFAASEIKSLLFTFNLRCR